MFKTIEDLKRHIAGRYDVARYEGAMMKFSDRVSLISIFDREKEPEDDFVVGMVAYYDRDRDEWHLIEGEVASSLAVFHTEYMLLLGACVDEHMNAKDGFTFGLQ